MDRSARFVIGSLLLLAACGESSVGGTPTAADGGTDADVASPSADSGRAVSPGENVTITVDDGFGCALASGALSCWGANEFGQLGQGNKDGHTHPTPLHVLDGVSHVAAGFGFACAVADGRVLCWGSNVAAKAGVPFDDARKFPVKCTEGIDGTPCVLRPTPVDGVEDAVEVAVGRYHACARTAQGAVRCWGDNTHVQLGAPPKVPYEFSGVPRVVSLPSPASELAAGALQGSSRDREGDVTSWGNSSIEGDGAPPVAANVKADRLFGGHGGVVAVRNGRIAEWGRALVFTGVNFDPTSLSDVREVAFGASSSACVMSVGGDVSCWGWNEFGQPGVPSTDTCIGVSGAGSCAQRPIRLPLAGRAVHIAGNCAVLENADVWCWRRAGLARVANFARP